MTLHNTSELKEQIKLHTAHDGKLLAFETADQAQAWITEAMSEGCEVAA